MVLAGRATAHGTRDYAARNAAARESQGYREAFGLNLSTIGLGTYLGAVDAATDAGYAEACRSAVLGGLNVVDTAINYRNQRSERVIGETLATLVAAEEVAREELFVATKGGFLAPDADVADPHATLRKEYVETGLVTPQNLVVDAHCMDPRYLEDQVRRSRDNLGVQTIDLYYVHNPETQLQQVDAEVFHERLRAAFVALERAVAQGHVARYGIATWDGLRVPFAHPAHVGLEDVVRLAGEAAREAGRERHSFAAVQAPLNLGMPEAVVRATQRVGGEEMPLAAAAQRLGVAWFTSASLLQGRLAEGLPLRLAQRIGAVGTNAQTALQAARSAPGVTCALVGMSKRKHVESALELMRGTRPGASGVWESG